MTDYAREVGRVRNPVLLISAVTWIVLLTEPEGPHGFAHCPAAIAGTKHLSESLLMLLSMSSPLSLIVGWGLMLVAMMSPTLIAPIQHVRMQSLTHRRFRSIMLFLAGYAVIWTALGGLILVLELVFRIAAPQSYLPAVAAFLLALVWQISPIKQRCLNRCHAHTPLAAFGFTADIDACSFGFTQGIWCAGSCWALMLFPMLLPQGHIVAMAIVTFLIFSERLEEPRPLSWRWRGSGKAIRILVAQTRIRVHAYL